MSDRSGYIGRTPSDSSVVIARQSNTLSGIQTSFVFDSGYDPGYLDVYLNGLRLIAGVDYYATDTQNVVLESPAHNGDVIEIVAYKAFNLANVLTSAVDFDVSNDLTVDGVIGAGGSGTFGGSISAGGSFTSQGIYGTNASFTGVVTSTEYYGDGSNLTGITAGATLSAGSGAQRIVVTSLTSGTMTAAATDAELSYNSDTDTLSATNFTGNGSGLTNLPSTLQSITTAGNTTTNGASFGGPVSVTTVTATVYDLASLPVLP